QRSQKTPFAAQLKGADLSEFGDVHGPRSECGWPVGDQHFLLDEEGRAHGSLHLGAHLQGTKTGHAGLAAANQKARAYAANALQRRDVPRDIHTFLTALEHKTRVRNAQRTAKRILRDRSELLRG